MSWKAEVQLYGDSNFYGNQLRFATDKEAQAYAVDLACRWTAVETWRVVWEEDSSGSEEGAGAQKG